MALQETPLPGVHALPEASARKPEILDNLVVSRPLSFGRMALIRLRQDNLTLAALCVLATIALLSLMADTISTHVLHVDPDKTDLLATFEGPSARHWLGTDQLGRDQLSRLLYGGRVSLAIGVFGAAVTMSLGVVVGLSAAYWGGWVDDAAVWVINTLQSIPTIFLLLLIAALFRPSAFWLTIWLGLLGWTGASRMVRGEVFSIKERDFVVAARALGSSELRIMFLHLLPNVMPIVITIAAMDIGSLILTESALSFLGLGVQPPTATWGNMLSKAQQYFHLGPHLVIFPGLLMTATVLCLYLIGDGLRDALDPRLK